VPAPGATGRVPDRQSGTECDVLRIRYLASAAAAILGVACGGSNQTPGLTSPGTATATASGPLVFRASPIDPATILWIQPLGNLNPPGHAIPTSHIYFYFADPNQGPAAPLSQRTSVFAPADGMVASVLSSEGADMKITVNATNTVFYFIDHVQPDVPLTSGTKVTAGERLGTTGTAFAMDLGVTNYPLNVFFISPSRYTTEDLHGDAPLKYYAEPLRGQLYSKVQSVGPNLDGQFAFDISGRLSGNWYQQQNQLVPLVFACNTYDESQVRISISGGLSTTGVFAIGPGDPSPGNISVASGPVVYNLTSAITGPPVSGFIAGQLLVQMTDDQTLRAEFFPASNSAAAFTGAAAVFVR
jgi:hypothetical protein